MLTCAQISTGGAQQVPSLLCSDVFHARSCHCLILQGPGGHLILIKRGSSTRPNMKKSTMLDSESFPPFLPFWKGLNSNVQFCISGHIVSMHDCCVLRSVLCATDIAVNESDLSSSLQNHSSQRRRAQGLVTVIHTEYREEEREVCRVGSSLLHPHPLYPPPALLSKL